jgi:hypothetical protein
MERELGGRGRREAGLKEETEDQGAEAGEEEAGRERGWRPSE